MTLEEPIPDLIDWMLPALITFVQVTAVVSFLGFLIGFVVCAVRHGPVEGFYRVAKLIGAAVRDISQFSIRRTIAMAILAVQEAIRRRVIIVFGLFVLILLFGSWYLDVKSDNPARLYLTVVLTASSYLVLALGLFLSVFSLPNDIKNRTIYTIVTKPVRPLEIVGGRILGFTLVGTLLLAAMCLMSYLFVVRGLSHEHTISASELQPAAEEGVELIGETSFAAHHRHVVRIFPDGTGETDLVMGHRHSVRQIGEGANATYELGPPQGMLQARVPRYGSLRFLDRSGKPGAGINVGAEWTYRSYVEGGTLAAAIWTFENVTPERYPDGLSLELNLSVFRTHKGNIEEGILGSITVRNPNNAAKIQSSEQLPFTAKEFVSDRILIPTKLKAIDADGEVQDVDLFEDLTDDGNLEIWIRCSEPGQYYGMAEADVYVLETEASFRANFVKGFLGIWIQLVLVTTFGVMFSTFLSGPVAMLATLSTVVVGVFRNFIIELVDGTLMGGGPIESTIRVVTQANMQSDLEIGTVGTTIVQGIDWGFLVTMQAMSAAVPNYLSFSTGKFVSYGYDIASTLLIEHLITAFAYVLVVSLIGYFFMKTREVAA